MKTSVTIPDMTFTAPANFALKSATGIAFHDAGDGLDMPESIILFVTDDGKLRFPGGTANPEDPTSGLMQSLAWCKARGITVAPEGMMHFEEMHRMWSMLHWQGANMETNAYTSSNLPPFEVADYEVHGIMPTIFMEGPAERLARVWVQKVEGGHYILACDKGDDVCFVNEGVATITHFILTELYRARRENRRPNAFQQVINGYPFVGGPVPLNPA